LEKNGIGEARRKTMAKFAEGSEGAKVYRDDGSRAAWYKRTATGWAVYTKRNSRAKTSVQFVTQEREADDLIEKFFEMRGGEYLMERKESREGLRS
jgi:hypothetical protein